MMINRNATINLALFCNITRSQQFLINIIQFMLAFKLLVVMVFVLTEILLMKSAAWGKK